MPTTAKYELTVIHCRLRLAHSGPPCTLSNMNSCVYYTTEDLGSAWIVILSTSLPLKRIVYNLNYLCILYVHCTVQQTVTTIRNFLRQFLCFAQVLLPCLQMSTLSSARMANYINAGKISCRSIILRKADKCFCFCIVN